MGKYLLLFYIITDDVIESSNNHFIDICLNLGNVSKIYQKNPSESATKPYKNQMTGKCYCSC